MTDLKSASSTHLVSTIILTGRSSNLHSAPTRPVQASRHRSTTLLPAVGRPWRASEINSFCGRPGLFYTSLLETRQPHGRQKSTSSHGPSQQASLHHRCTNITCRPGLLCTTLLETKQPHGRRKSTSSPGPRQRASLHHHCCNCLTCQLAATVLGARIPRVVTQKL